MRLLIGLGNPGAQYVGTRHNIGFDVIHELSRRFSLGRAQVKFQAELQDVMIAGEKSLLITPMTYMNCSGDSVWQFVNFYKPDLSEIAVICDDMNLPVGRIRWKPSGSAGGQKGLSSIIRRLGTEAFPRLRIGVGRPPGKMDVTSWVLGRWQSDEQEAVRQSVLVAADSIEKWCADGIELTMTTFNRNPANE
ncbi:MAG: aminoacyl-tRNA hydrolase [Planctomycetaceae bacterium]